jgi:hypothetical protein
MVEDARTAKHVLELRDNRNTRLMESLELVRTSCPDKEYQAHRAGIAPLTGPLYLRWQPISIENPALIPAAALRASVAGWRKLGRNQRDH